MGALRKLEEIEKEVVSNVKGKSAVLILDTGGLIDLSCAVRQENLGANGRSGRDPSRKKMDSFLDSLRERTFLMITPKTYREIYDHGKVRVNSHTRELPVEIGEYAFEFMLRSNLFFADLDLGEDAEQARYDAYWTSKLCCMDCSKKDVEGYSLVDLEILYSLASLVGAKIGEYAGHDFPGDEIDRVGVLSSDAHLVRGADFLKNRFGDRYSSVFSIPTRRSHRN